ncbi:MAG TPA: DUF222 domain-containing protein [Longimicrobiales bacterium]|nr:DUF222 domain-containing protein [Longimicrobiales bacterium]
MIAHALQAQAFAGPYDAPRTPYLLLVREASPAYGSPAEPEPEPDRPDASSRPPDPFEDADLLEELGDEIATLAAHIHAATHRLLVLIADFDRRGGWELDGHRSCAHWLAFRTGIDLGAAREKVRTARVLVGLPETSASMARGELSFSQVRALSRVARPDNERELLELARGCTTAQLERMVRGWKRTNSRKDEAALERERQDSRTFSVFPDLDGMYVVRGKLPPEVGLLLMRAIEAASDQIYREQPVEALETDKAAAHRRADALALLAERAMAAGLSADAEAPVSGTRAERYQVVLHVDAETLSADGGPTVHGGGCPGRSELDDGTRVSAETSRRVSCDAGLVRMRHGPDGQILDVGRRTRTIPPALRRALEARDRRCRFPGCGLRFTDGHHVRHWADGGETSLSNTLLLCRHHHTLVHEGGWRVEWWGEGRPAFYGPKGQMLFEGRWQPPELPNTPVEALIEEQRARGVEPDELSAGARWKREDDIPAEVYLTAAEALL